MEVGLEGCLLLLFGTKIINRQKRSLISLLAINDTIDSEFLITGLQILHELGKKEKMVAILHELDANELQEICQSNLFPQELEEVNMCENMETCRNKKYQSTNGTD